MPEGVGALYDDVEARSGRVPLSDRAPVVRVVRRHLDVSELIGDPRKVDDVRARGRARDRDGTRARLRPAQLDARSVKRVLVRLARRRRSEPGYRRQPTNRSAQRGCFRWRCRSPGPRPRGRRGEVIAWRTVSLWPLFVSPRGRGPAETFGRMVENYCEGCVRSAERIGAGWAPDRARRSGGRAVAGAAPVSA